MNERFGNVQYDYSNQAKYLQMITNHDQNYSLSNKTNNNANVVMPANNSNYSLETLTSNMQGASLNNYGMDFTTNSNRLLDLYNSNSNKFAQTARQPTANMDRSNIMTRYANLPNNSLNGKFNPHLMNNEQRMFTNSMGMNSIHPIHMALANNNHSNNTSANPIMGSPSMIHKSFDTDMIISKKDIQRNIPKTIPSNPFYHQSNLKLVSQQQRDNELENPKYIVFPPVLQSATQLRQGKQHLVRTKSAENAVTIDEDMRKILLFRISACLVSANIKNDSKISESVLHYTDITPIESTYDVRKSKTFNRPSICYKAFHSGTEQFVLFRRFPGLLLQSAKEHQLIERYRKIKHPGLISINHVFITEAFDDHSTVFVMDYCPCSVTALQTHVSDVSKLIGFASPFNVSQQARPYSSSKKASDLNMLSEEKSWCYLIQLINIIRYVHNVLGLYCKIIDPSKILIQYPDRIRVNCFGLIDFLISEENSLMGTSLDDTNDLIAQQLHDLEMLGQFMLCVICGTTIAIQENDSNIAFELLQRFYSSNLKTTVMKLIRSEFHSINDVATSTFAECYNHVTNMYLHIDYLELNLMKELECGKLFRLVCKLATICERNELGMDRNWSDYGANYQLKLFRDFVFHQVDSNGAPYLDLAHIVTCLNKLDAGSNENVCLISRDGLNMFCVTFADLKQVLDDSFEQLLSHKNEANLENFPNNSVIN